MSAPNPRNRLGWTLGIAAAVVAVATIAGAISVMGTPGEQRAARIDDRRVDDLVALDNAVRAYAEKHERLPQDLATLTRQPGRRLPLTDPQHGTPYEYLVTAKHRYRLCAVFTTDTAAAPRAGRYFRKDWAHGIGRTCFDRRRKTGNAAALAEMGDMSLE